MAKLFARFNHKKGKFEKCSGCMETFIYGALWKKQNPTYKVALLVKPNFHLKLEVSAPVVKPSRRLCK